MAERTSLSGLTDQEAKEFHGAFMGGFVAFTIIAIIAHVLVWMWRPWFPGVTGYTTGSLDLPSTMSLAHTVATTLFG
jgi:light-harvesting complex 1 beta chain